MFVSFNDAKLGMHDSYFLNTKRWFGFETVQTILFLLITGMHWHTSWSPHTANLLCCYEKFLQFSVLCHLWSFIEDW